MELKITALLLKAHEKMMRLFSWLNKREVHGPCLFVISSSHENETACSLVTRITVSSSHDYDLICELILLRKLRLCLSKFPT